MSLAATLPDIPNTGDTLETIEEFAEAMFDGNMAYYLDEDPATLGVMTKDGWRRMFTDEQCEILRAMVDSLSGEQIEAYYDAVLNKHAAQQFYFNTMDPASQEDTRREACFGVPEPKPETSLVITIDTDAESTVRVFKTRAGWLSAAAKILADDGYTLPLDADVVDTFNTFSEGKNDYYSMREIVMEP